MLDNRTTYERNNRFFNYLILCTNWQRFLPGLLLERPIHKYIYYHAFFTTGHRVCGVSSTFLKKKKGKFLFRTNFTRLWIWLYSWNLAQKKTNELFITIFDVPCKYIIVSFSYSHFTYFAYILIILLTHLYAKRCVHFDLHRSYGSAHRIIWSAQITNVMNLNAICRFAWSVFSIHSNNIV